MSNVIENEGNINAEVKAAEQNRNAPASGSINDAQMSNQERLSKAAAWYALQSAMYRHDIMIGNVASALVKDGIAFAGVVMDKYPDAIIYIPFDEFYREIVMRNAAELKHLGKGQSEAEVSLNRQIGILRHAVGAVIPFIITNMASDQHEDGTTTSVIVASRRAALAVIEKRNYGTNANGTRRINEGDLISGRIVSVGRYGMRANFGGVDTEVKLAQATHRFVSSLLDIFAPGDAINAVIREIKQNEDGGIVLGVDCRAAERAQNMHRANLAPTGSVVTGTITSSTPDKLNPGLSTLHAYIDSLGLPCVIRRLSSATLGHDVRNGDRAVIVIIGTTSNGFLRGEVRRFLPRSTQSSGQ